MNKLSLFNIGLGFSILLNIMQCTNPVFAARVGHTVNNGGGSAELKFMQVWADFEFKLAACLQGFCQLTAEEIQFLQAIQKTKMKIFEIDWLNSKKAASAKKSVLTIDAHKLYNAQSGEPLSRVAMLTEIVEGLAQKGSGCEAYLVTFNTKNIVQQIHQVQYFRQLPVSNGYWSVGLTDGMSKNFLLKTPSSEIDLYAVLAGKLGLKNSADFSVDFALFTGGKRGDGVSGQIYFEKIQKKMWFQISLQTVDQGLNAKVDKVLVF